MSDSTSEIKFAKSVGIAVEPDALVFTHDYGQVTLPWDSIDYEFLVVWERKMASHLPLFIMYCKNSEYFYYIDGNTLSRKALKLGDGSDESDATPQEMVMTDVRKAKEDDFKKVITVICEKATKARKDKPIPPYVKGNPVVVPKFPKLKEISDYCFLTISKMDSGDFSEEPLTASGGGGVAIVRKKMTRGMTMEGKYIINEVFSSATETHYVVSDPDSGKFYALKTLPDTLPGDMNLINLFINQAVMWTRISAHPNFVKADMFKIIDGVPYVFAEHTRGTDLETLTRAESLSVRSSVEIGIQVCEALNHASRQAGMAHRDIRLSNCIITEDDRLRLTNFGMSRVFDDIPQKGPLSDRCLKLKGQELSSHNFPLLESLPYMAPELFTTLEESSARTDVYSFGVVMYWLLTHINPFYDESPAKILKNHLLATPASPDQLNSRVPEQLARLVLKCINKDPALRYSDFTQILSELNQVYMALTGSAFSKPHIEKAMSEDYWVNKGLSLKSMNRDSEAIEAFDEALKVNPESLRARYYRGSSLSRRLAEGMSDAQDNWEFWFWQAEAHRKAGKNDETFKCFDRALRLNEKEIMTWVQVARLMIEIGNFDNALTSYDRALAHHHGAAEILDYKGNLRLQMQDYQGALDCFNQSLALNSTYKWAIHHRGMALYSLGSYDEAIGVLEKVLEMDPGFYNAWLRIGDCYRELEKIPESLKAYQKAIDLEPHNLDAYLASIQVLKKSARWEEALDFVEKALEIEPANASLLFDRAGICFKLGYYGESRIMGEKLLSEGALLEQGQLLLETVSRLEAEQKGLFDRIFVTPVIPMQSFCNDLNGLLSVFISARDAIDFMENSRKDDARGCYLKGCLYFIEGAYESAMNSLLKAIDDPQISEQAQRVKKRVEECMPRTFAVKELLQFAKMLKKKETETDDEMLLNGLEKMKANKFQDARSYFRDIFTKNINLYSCIYYMSKNYEQEKNTEKAQHYLAEFIKYVPLSIGINKEKLKASRKSNPAEAEEMYHQLLGSYRYNCLLWLEYIRFLAEQNRGETLQLLVPGLLADTFREWEGIRETAQYWNIRGFLQLYLGRFREGRESIAKAREYDLGKGSAPLEIPAFFEGIDLLRETVSLFMSILSPTGAEKSIQGSMKQ